MQKLGFLPPSHRPGLVQSRTTNYQRTVATLRGVLTGLFPDTATPIKVTTSADVDEIMFADSKSCPHFGVFVAAAKAALFGEQGLHVYLEVAF